MLELGRERRVWIDEVSRDDRSGRELRVHRLPAIKWKSADLCVDPAGTDLATCTSIFRRCSGRGRAGDQAQTLGTDLAVWLGGGSSLRRGTHRRLPMRWPGARTGLDLISCDWRSDLSERRGGVAWRCRLAVWLGGVAWRCSQLATRNPQTTSDAMTGSPERDSTL